MERGDVPSDRVRFGAFELDLRAGELHRNGAKLRLQEQPLRILRVLLENPGEVVTREELRQRIWPADTFVDFDHSLYTAITKLREALRDSSAHPKVIETLPRRGYRFIAPIESVSAEPTRPSETKQTSPRITKPGSRRVWRWAAAASIVVVLGLVGGGYFFFHRATALGEKDSIVVADFANTTGDPVFDGTLRRGLSAQLEQSPLLHVVSDEQIAETLRYMEQPADARLTTSLARQVCQRNGSAAVIDGSIAQVGAQYDLVLNAVSCSTGAVLASAQADADDKNHVLGALGKLASELRSKLGESQASLAKFDAPVMQVTTPSLEALQAYNLCVRANATTDFSKALPLCQRAISLDPNFASAHEMLGFAYSNSGETTSAIEYFKRAYDLRDRVSESEKFHILDAYYFGVTGNLDKEVQSCESWVQTYPRDPIAFNELGVAYRGLGQLDKALAAHLEALRLAPTSALLHSNVTFDYVYLNRLDEARATIQQARSRNVDTQFSGLPLYLIGFLQSDAGAMADQAARARGGPRESVVLAQEANTAAYSGQLSKANNLTRRAIESAERMQLRERAANYQAKAAIRAAMFGDGVEAVQMAAAAWQLSTGRDTKAGVALALALSNNRRQAEKLADDLATRFPENTLLQSVALPTIRAAVALDEGNPSSAVDSLQAAAPYELSSSPFGAVLWLRPVYLRGAAYLAARQGAQAAAEYQKILDRPAIVLNDPIGVLAHLGLARAYALQGDTAKAKTAYQAFLALWKDADPDIPVLKQAKVEYAKLQ
jgi:eukaryotic-like serine/threonine-protein kinase